MTNDLLFEQLDAYIKANFVEESIDFVCDEITDHTHDDPEDPFTLISESVSCRPVTDGDLELPGEDEMNESFQEIFLNFFNAKVSGDENVIYQRVPVDKSLVGKIKSDGGYVPTKPLVILLGFAMELDRNEMDLLLKSARYHLSRSQKDELVVAFCLEKAIYDSKLIDELLDDQDLPLISQRI